MVKLKKGLLDDQGRDAKDNLDLDSASQTSSEHSTDEGAYHATAADGAVAAPSPAESRPSLTSRLWGRLFGTSSTPSVKPVKPLEQGLLSSEERDDAAKKGSEEGGGYTPPSL